MPPTKPKSKSKAASTKWSQPKVSCLNSSFLIDNHFIIALIHFDQFLLMYSAYQPRRIKYGYYVILYMYTIIISQKTSKIEQVIIYSFSNDFHFFFL